MLNISLSLGWSICNLMQLLYRLILQNCVPTQRSSCYICYTTAVNAVLPSGPTQWHINFCFFLSHFPRIPSESSLRLVSITVYKGKCASCNSQRLLTAPDRLLITSHLFAVNSWCALIRGEKAAHRIITFISTLSQYSESFTRVFLSNSYCNRYSTRCAWTTCCSQ